MTTAPGGSGVCVMVAVCGMVGEGGCVLVEVLLGFVVGDAVIEGIGCVMLASVAVF